MARPAPISDPPPLGPTQRIYDEDGAVTGYRRLDQRWPLPVMPFLAHLKGLDAETARTAGPPAFATGSLEPFRFS